MLCDACLMYLYQGCSLKVREVFLAAAAAEVPTIEAVMQALGVTSYRVRSAVAVLRGTGLMWRASCLALSESGQRLAEILDGANQPEPARALCDDCLLEIGQELSSDEYAVLAQLSDRATHSRHDLVVSTEISAARLQEMLRSLEGAQLIQSVRGRIFRLSATGRRLERLFRQQQVNYSPTSNIQLPSSILHSPF